MPRRWIFLDTEARREQTALGGIQRWRLGVTCYDGWNDHKNERRAPAWRYWYDKDELWDYIDAVCGNGKRTMLVAHNVGYDLRISDAFRHLERRRWLMDQPVLTDKATIIRWRRGDEATLQTLDTYSWLPHSLATIGELCG